MSAAVRSRLLPGDRLRRKSQGGFTMVELVIVVAILIALTLMVLPTLKTMKDLARQTRAMEEIRDIEKSVNAYAIDKGVLPNNLSEIGLQGGVPLDPWKRPYVYVNLANGGAPRKDIALVPLNTDFDLYSMGPDGASALSLTDSTSADDVVRGANGSFVGTASKY
ncbi:prepilin-type N-terminal cleavage/methylation domain-containing protein [Geomesophilobacter sediminis]|uniref:Prepilin-type N-terminal cleavage/methylation domain-containing protein n=1 Tax=Geomesophilobacter sediminis TaxID=2798584 RepID=A0A8J7LXZ9_9BACT|nr:prepilin-type N-terminal cleavage/methylation domain-containing protein [Geomesophilobacter sediminis]MBJ6723952.1 prepilin-type N-terminal cleavage/methylation domain-containing protein [Geomesophilobacter sediminis]